MKTYEVTVTTEEAFQLRSETYTDVTEVDYLGGDILIKGEGLTVRYPSHTVRKVITRDTKGTNYIKLTDEQRQEVYSMPQSANIRMIVNKVEELINGE